LDLSNENFRRKTALDISEISALDTDRELPADWSCGRYGSVRTRHPGAVSMGPIPDLLG